MKKRTTFFFNLWGGLSCFLLFFLFKKLVYKGGYDLLHPLAPYSQNGCPRRNFLKFCELSKNKKITEREFLKAVHGDKHPTRESTKMAYERSRRMRKYFSIPIFFR